MRGFVRLLGLVLVGFVPLAAQGASVQLRYLADGSAISDAETGTIVTVGLYSDPACQDSIEEVPVAIDSFTIETLKLRAPKGGVKPPKAVRLEVTVPVNLNEPQIFVTLSGAGIVPVGQACQAQRLLPFGQINWITVYPNAAIRAYSPSLAGTTVTRPEGQPVGVYCVDLPDFPPATSEAAVGSIQHNLGVAQNWALTVTTVYGSTCESGEDILVEIYDAAGAPADAAFSLIIPGPGDVFVAP